MAKNKDYPSVAGIMAYVPPPVPDNNPAGPYPLPNDSLNGYRRKAGRICFAENVGKGESPNIGDVNVNTANGVASARGQGKNCQYNWGSQGNSGIWNKNEGWDGGNLTGM